MTLESSLRHSLALLFCGILLASGLVACDTSVQTVQPLEDFNYTLNGYLDLRADTQWIRVEDLNDGVPYGSPESIDATVMLSDLDAGTSYELRDSLVSFRSGPSYHTFWTDQDILPETRYRLDVIRGDTVRSRVITATPNDQISGELNAVFGLTFYLDVENVEILAGASFELEVENVCFGGTTVVTTDALADVRSRGDDRYRIPVAFGRAISEFSECFSLLRPEVDVIVTEGGPDWPGLDSTRTIPRVESIVPQGFTNVDGGEGYVGGVARYRWTVDFSGNARIIEAPDTPTAEPDPTLSGVSGISFPASPSTERESD